MFLRSVLVLLLLITLMQGAAQKYKTEVASGKFPTSQNKRLQKELDSLFSSYFMIQLKLAFFFHVCRSNRDKNPAFGIGNPYQRTGRERNTKFQACHSVGLLSYQFMILQYYYCNTGRGMIER